MLLQAAIVLKIFLDNTFFEITHLGLEACKIKVRLVITEWSPAYNYEVLLSLYWLVLFDDVCAHFCLAHIVLFIVCVMHFL